MTIPEQMMALTNDLDLAIGALLIERFDRETWLSNPLQLVVIEGVLAKQLAHVLAARLWGGGPAKADRSLTRIVELAQGYANEEVADARAEQASQP
jgi:hypothetical protein